MHSLSRRSAAALVLWALTGVTAIAAPLGQPQYIGKRTGDPERDTYGHVLAMTPQAALCIVGPRQYFGPVTGDAERDNYAYPTALFNGPVCPARTVANR